jgi:hypothetical protein
LSLPDERVFSARPGEKKRGRVGCGWPVSRKMNAVKGKSSNGLEGRSRLARFALVREGERQKKLKSKERLFV